MNTNTHITEDTSTDDCNICAHAAEHGWFGPALKPARTHCHDCHRSWASLREGHCTICCRHFADVRAFDYHLTSDSCQDPAAATRQDGSPRLVLKERPFGEVWCVIDYRKHARPYAHTPAIASV